MEPVQISHKGVASLEATFRQEKRKTVTTSLSGTCLSDRLLLSSISFCTVLFPHECRTTFSDQDLAPCSDVYAENFQLWRKHNQVNHLYKQLLPRDGSVLPSARTRVVRPRVIVEQFRVSRVLWQIYLFFAVFNFPLSLPKTFSTFPTFYFT